MSLKLNGSSAGSVSFDAPSDTSPSGTDVTLTLPTSAGSAGQYLRNSGTAGTLEFGDLPTLGFTSSSQALTTSGSSATITGLDTSATLYIVSFGGISMAGATSPQLLMQIGNGSLSTSNYSWNTAHSGGVTDNSASSSSVRLSQNGFANAANVYNGIIQIACDTGDAVVGNWVFAVETSLVGFGAFRWTGGTSIDRISLQTSDTFDSGRFKVHSR